MRATQTVKEPFDFDEAFRRLRPAVASFAKAAMFDLRDRGYTSPFEQLVACILSIRTRDEEMLTTAMELFEQARTPQQIAALSPDEIDALITRSTFHEGKSHQIHDIAVQVVEEFGGELPCDFDTLVSLRGVGPKCAGLTLGVACGQLHIGVDVHVHRVTNRWGIVATKTPEKTLTALQKILPERYSVEINERLVPFGKHICTGTLPKCSTCPLLSMCQQVGVTKHR
jgi:endonuclease-3